MSLHDQASLLAAKGRGPDSRLVHMSPQEVSGLEALAQRHYGQGLTINPDTGLPEAGILSSILPMVAGIALSATGIGAPMAAMLVGGGTALATGSLQRGLMAGLGAFGGAGMGSTLSSLGTTAAAAAPSAAAQTMASTVAPVAETAAAFGDIGAAGFEGTAGLGVGNPASWAPWETSGAALADTASMTPTMAHPASAANYMNGMDVASDMSLAQQAVGQPGLMGGISELMKPGGFNKFVTASGGPMGLAKQGMMGMMSAGSMGGKKKFSDDGDDSLIRPYDYDPRTQAYTARAPYPARDARTRFAAGGVAGLMDTGSDKVSPTRKDYTYDPVTQAFTLIPPALAIASIATPGDPSGTSGTGTGVGFATDASSQAADFSGLIGALEGQGYAETGGSGGMDAGVAGVGDGGWGSDLGVGDSDGGEGDAGYAVGGIAGLLKGPGDGVSDSIPATVNGKNPAALADGEFVIPARIVSELGNGSTDAGARKLYAMMDRIQRQRSSTTGKNRVAVDSGAHRMLPA
jgi:hypothetical protein